MRCFGLKNLQAHIRHVRNSITVELCFILMKGSRLTRDQRIHDADKNWSFNLFFDKQCLICFFFQGIEMAKLLESHIKSDPNFEVPAERHLGLVVFCLKVCDVNPN